MNLIEDCSIKATMFQKGNLNKNYLVFLRILNKFCTKYSKKILKVFFKKRIKNVIKSVRSIFQLMPIILKI